jgi:ABC-2 type transport system ATP-binding protein
VGFNPELSGRDNVFLNGALLGFTHKQMAEMYDEIVEFSELEQFMDQKLKNYSSGMQVRLAFSIAIKAKNEILIFDEVLAVGDEAFQRKCLDVFEQYKASKQTVILVTHDMETVRKFCNKAMLLSEGKIVELGDPGSVANKYSQLNQGAIDKNTGDKNKKIKAKHLKVRITDSDGKTQQSFNIGDHLFAHASWEGLDVSSMESIGVNIFKQSGEHITGINSRYAEHKKNWKENGIISIEYILTMTPGKYFLLVEIFNYEGKRMDTFRGPHFSLKGIGIEWSGLVELSHAWHDE